MQDYKSLSDVFEAFPDEKSCIDYLEPLRWPNGIVCPLCASTRKIYKINRSRNYKCADCRKQFSIRKGTIFEESRLPLRKWFAVAWLLTANRTGISSTRVALEVEVTQKTALVMLERLKTVARLSTGNNKPKPVETMSLN